MSGHAPPAPGRAEWLKPCPFCGSAARMVQIGSSRWSCQVECTNCNTHHESADEGEKSGSSWNRRPAPAVVAEAGDVRRWCVFPPHADKVVSEADYDAATQQLAEVRGERDSKQAFLTDVNTKLNAEITAHLETRRLNDDLRRELAIREASIKMLQNLVTAATQRAEQVERELAATKFVGEFDYALTIGRIKSAFDPVDGTTLFDSYDDLRARLDVLRAAIDAALALPAPATNATGEAK